MLLEPAGDVAALIDDPAVRRVLSVTAHPDDVDFGAGGSVAALTRAGVEVSYCVVTDGDAGGFDRGTARDEIPAIRRAEQRRAGAVLGVETIEFLGYRDGEVVASMALRRDLSRVIRTFRPDRIICPSPERFYERLPASHPDHLAVGEAALCAIYPDARNPFAYPELLDEGLEPHVVHEVWLAGHPSANVFVDITEFIDAKLEALRAHESQLADVERTEALVRDWGTSVAESAGFAPGRSAEAFFKFTTW